MDLDRRTVIAFAGSAGVLPVANSVAAAPAPQELFCPLRLTDFLTPEMLADVQAGTLSVDCAPALQAALDHASGKERSSLQSGGKLLVPAGRYLLATPVSLSWRSEDKVIDDGDMRRVTIEGDGQANTIFFYRGEPERPALEIKGFLSRPGSGMWLRLSVTGLQLVRDHHSRFRGTGLALDGAALVRFVDMQVSAFDVNIDLIDTLRVYMESVHILGGNIGLRTRGRRFSNPNVYKLVHCSISGNINTGLHAVRGCNLSLDSCALEGNGRDQSRGSCVLLEGGPAEGGTAGHFNNCYFENNMVLADVILDWKDDAAGTIKFTACTFQRTSADRAANHHLLLRSPSTLLLAHVDSCGFKSFGDYSPSAERAAVRIEGRGVKVTWTANLFQHMSEAPPDTRIS